MLMFRRSAQRYHRRMLNEQQEILVDCTRDTRSGGGALKGQRLSVGECAEVGDEELFQDVSPDSCMNHPAHRVERRLGDRFG